MYRDGIRQFGHITYASTPSQAYHACFDHLYTHPKVPLYQLESLHPTARTWKERARLIWRRARIAWRILWRGP